MIKTGTTEVAGPNGQAFETETAVGPEAERMPHGLPQLPLQPGLVVEVLALELTVEQRNTDPKNEGRGGQPPAEATARTG